MRFLFRDVQALNVKECHFVLPRVQSLFSFIINDHTYLGAIFIAFAPMTTYLKDLIQSIGRYGRLT